MLVDFKKIDDEKKTISDLKNIYSSKSLFKKELFYTWEIPVCYDLNLENDIKILEKNLSLKKDEIFYIHSSSTYLIYNIGFLPGFVYLGGMDKRIHHPRKDEPSQNIPKGSIGIGGEQTGIYPNKSPGGWYVIGNCPVDLFDPKKSKPCFIKPGDEIKFKMISKQQYSGFVAGDAPSFATDVGALSVGNRTNEVNVAQTASRGELSYLRGEAGRGDISNFRPAASGRRGYAVGSEGVVVGERGPEVISPSVPVNITPNDQIGGAPMNVNFTINAVDAAGLEQTIQSQRGNIIGMIREAANGYGEDFLEQVDIDTLDTGVGTTTGGGY